MTDQDYDLVVIGSGPAGQKAAINAAKLGKRGLRIRGQSDLPESWCSNGILI